MPYNTKDFDTLANLFRKMDQTWDEIAAKYGFQCNGCEDNCCFSLFFHHTHVEKGYLIHGFDQLPGEDQKEILTKADSYYKATFAQEDSEPASLKIPCPLLRNGQCRLYKYRPMICRMHGLPHELNKPGFQTIKGPGCDAGNFDDQDYIPFDRTPFYREMAGIEMAYRSETGTSGKVKETIAQILISSVPR